MIIREYSRAEPATTHSRAVRSSAELSDENSRTRATHQRCTTARSPHSTRSDKNNATAPLPRRGSLNLPTRRVPGLIIAVDSIAHVADDCFPVRDARLRRPADERSAGSADGGSVAETIAFPGLPDPRNELSLPSTDTDRLASLRHNSRRSSAVRTLTYKPQVAAYSHD